MTEEQGTEATQADGAAEHISRSRSRQRIVTDQGQADEHDSVDEDTSALELLRRRAESATSGIDQNLLSPSFIPQSSKHTLPDKEVTLVLPGTNVTLDSPTATRPKADGIAFPFKLGRSPLNPSMNASMVTLKSERAVTPNEIAGEDKSLDVATQWGAEAEKQERAKLQANGDKVRGERPPIDRFETAREEL